MGTCAVATTHALLAASGATAAAASRAAFAALAETAWEALAGDEAAAATGSEAASGSIAWGGTAEAGSGWHVCEANRSHRWSWQAACAALPQLSSHLTISRSHLQAT